MDNLYNCHSLIIGFDGLPILQPQLLKTTGIGGFPFLEAIRGASAKRYFHLEKDWIVEIKVDPSQYDGEDISGKIVIPKIAPKSKAQTKFDGASVPLPWLVSFLSFGVLRPLGVMLTASIVHDFAFEYGCLYYLQENGCPQPHPVERHIADQLFYDIIKTVNNMPITAYIGWLAVRLGWFYVKYNGQPQGGKPPCIAVTIALTIVALLLLTLWGLIIVLGWKTLLIGISTIYLFILLLLKLTVPSTDEELTDINF